MPALACSNIIRSDATSPLSERIMAAREDWARITRGIQEAFTGLISAFGGVRMVRRERQPRPRSVRLVTWAARANTDRCFPAQLEQRKNRALLHHTETQLI